MIHLKRASNDDGWNADPHSVKSSSYAVQQGILKQTPTEIERPSRDRLALTILRTPFFQVQRQTTLTVWGEALLTEYKILLTHYDWDFIPPVQTRSYGERSFTYTASTLWNNLPEHLKNIDSIDKFKIALKTHLFNI